MDIFSQPDVLIFGSLKGLYLLGGVVYVIFSLVLVAQVKAMTQTLNGTIELPIKLISYIHLIVSVIALVLAFIIL